jgi:hypothetical protein
VGGREEGNEDGEERGERWKGRGKEGKGVEKSMVRNSRQRE